MSSNLFKKKTTQDGERSNIQVPVILFSNNSNWLSKASQLVTQLTASTSQSQTKCCAGPTLVPVQTNQGVTATLAVRLFASNQTKAGNSTVLSVGGHLDVKPKTRTLSSRESHNSENGSISTLTTKLTYRWEQEINTRAPSQKLLWLCFLILH